jgi:two-component system, LytTR family, response regulator
MKIKCIIIEDEPKAMSLLEDYVNKTPFLELAKTCFNPVDAMTYLQEHRDVDLAFFDINLPELSGIESATVISPAIKIIFTTAYSEYAAKSYEVNTIDYLMKPIVYSRFLQAVTKVKSAIERDRKTPETNSESSAFIKSGKKIIQINWDEVLYVEALREYLSIVTAKQKIVTYKRMSEFEEMQPSNFKRIHNSFIINLDKIEKVEDNLVFINNRQIPISKSYKDQFYTAIKGRLI